MTPAFSGIMVLSAVPVLLVFRVPAMKVSKARVSANVVKAGLVICVILVMLIDLEQAAVPVRSTVVIMARAMMDSRARVSVYARQAGQALRAIHARAVSSAVTVLENA